MTNRYFAFGSLLLMSFFQGFINVYIGGIESNLHRLYQFIQPEFTELTAYLFLGNGLGCIIGGTLIDRYGAGTITTIAGLISTLGILLLTNSSTFINFSVSEFIIGIGVSVWYPAGIKVIKMHFNPHELPFLAGIFLFANNLGSSALSGVVYLDKAYGLNNTNKVLFSICIVMTLYLVFTARMNNPSRDISTYSKSLLNSYFDQVRLMNNGLVLPVIVSQTIPTLFSYVFLPLWALPYLSMIVSRDSAMVIITSCLIIYGAAGIVLGKIYYRFLSPLAWMTFQFSGSAIALAFLIFTPIYFLNIWIVTVSLLVVSILLGANNTYLATYLADLFQHQYTGTISAVYGYIFQFLISAVTPIFGLTLVSSSGHGHYTVADYNGALKYLLLSFVFSGLLTLILQWVSKYYPKKIIIS